jgi:tripartite-type tricarboxylate transporter receptor subunit TctC
MLGRRGFSQAVAGAAMLPVAGRAQGTWPTRPPRWVVGYPPGGPSDVFARLIAAFIGPRLGQTMVVENRPGGGAVLASETVSRSAPDGYTLLHADNGNLVYNPALYSRLPYDPDRDLTGVGFIGRFPLFLVVRPDSPIDSLADYIAAAKQRVPTYGSPAVASPHHLAMEMLKRRAGFDATHVPYRGGPAAMQDLLSGTVDSVLIDCATGIPFLRDGKAKGLVVLSEARSAQAPTVPTSGDLGIGNAIAFGWQAMSAPTGSPEDAIIRLNAELNAAMASTEMQARTTSLGIEHSPWSPAQVNAFVARESAEWRPLIRDLGIRLDS